MGLPVLSSARPFFGNFAQNTHSWPIVRLSILIEFSVRAVGKALFLLSRLLKKMADPVRWFGIIFWSIGLLSVDHMHIVRRVVES